MNLLEVFKDSIDLVEIPAGTVIFAEGLAGNKMFVILKGAVEITLHDKLLAAAGPGEIVGEMALINSEIRSATATTQTDCLMVPIDQSSFDSLLQHVPDFSLHVMNVLATRLHTAYELLED
jgi:CRP/FNR family cyclic AMP-dependent transcriptional regulator